MGRLFLADDDGNVFSACSATAVTRSSIVTARHCLCQNPSATQSRFCLPQGGDTDLCMSLSGEEGFTSTLTSFVGHPGWADTCNWVESEGGLTYSTDSSAAAVDIAIGFLAENIPVSVIPTVPKVHLGDNAITFGLLESDAHGGTPEYFIVGFGDTNWPEDTPNNQSGVRRRGEVGTDLHLQSSSWGTVFESWYLESDANDDPAALASMSTGDSGGALFMQPMDGAQRVGTPYLVGVTSTVIVQSWDDDQAFAVTGKRKHHRDDFGDVRNSDLLALALAPDVDQDGVLDTNDNCPPSACLFANACANADQADTDTDLLGDACDLCATIRDAPGLGMLGPDDDLDRIGDVCDVCPHDPDQFQGDSDGDGVGDECDSCKDEENPYASCMLPSTCPMNICLKETGAQQGHCSTQGDDADGDGYGEKCDDCPSNPENGDYELFANSNVDMEGIENVTTLGDVCEQVPQYVARPVLTAFEDQNTQCPVGGQPETCRNVAKLFSSATIGHTTGNGSPTYEGYVGFRHCDCYDDEEELLDRETCLTTQCAILPQDYSNPASSYRRISIGVDGVGTPTYPATLTETSLTRSFTTSLSNSDDYAHPDDQLEGDAELENWRIGPTEMLMWPWLRDVEDGLIAGHPAADPIDTQKTGGILWSVVIGKITTGTRDSNAGKRLRSVYTYVRTPLVAAPEPLGPMEWEPALQCPTPDCFGWLRPGLDRIYPPDFQFIDHVREDMLLHAYDGEVVASADKRPGAWAAKEFMSQDLQDAMLAGKSMWLSPVEAEHVTRMLDVSVQGASVPTEWDSSSVVQMLMLEESKLFQEPVQGEGALAPSQRNGYTALFSATENAVFMLGGFDAWGGPTQDIWRFDVDSATWSSVELDGVGLQKVVDATYVPEQQRIAVVDRLDTEDDVVARIVIADLAEGSAQVVASYKDTGKDVVVGPDGEGGFVLFVGDAEKDSVMAYRFAIDADKGEITWLRQGELEGRLLGGAQLTDEGLTVPLELDELPYLFVLGDDELSQETSGPEAM